jgi:transcriptional regulator with XRE-family HTH domain
MVNEEVENEAFNRGLGERLRLARRSRGWSLTDVEVISDGEFKASVVGAYERGERSLTVHRMVRLAAVYAIPIDSLLPPPLDRPDTLIDLTSPELEEHGDGALMERYLGSIQMMRRSEAGELAIRSSDLRLLSIMLAEDRSQAPREP